MNIQRYNPKSKDQTGIISGEPGDVYHANPAISNSDLSLFLTDPKRFEAKRNGELKEKDSQDLLLGDIFHVLCLESIEVFNGRFVLDSICPPKPTKAQIEAHSKFDQNKKPTTGQVTAFKKQDKLIKNYNNFWKVHEGKKLIKFADFLVAKNMRESLFEDVDAGKLLDGFEYMHRELTLRTDELTYGFKVQSKLDIYDPQEHVAIDLKSVRNLDVFKRNYYDFGYYRQAAFYKLVFEAVVGRKLQEFYFIAVEKEPPYEVGVFKVSDEALFLGTEEIHIGLKSLGQAIKSGSFKKRYAGITQLTLYPYQREKIAERLRRIESEVAV